MKCENCKFSYKACNENVVACAKINDIDLESDIRFARISKVQGNVYSGWIKGGMGITRGYICDKTAFCDKYVVKDNLDVASKITEKAIEEMKIVKKELNSKLTETDSIYKRKIRKTFVGMNAENLLGKKSRKIIKYTDGQGRYYVVVGGEDKVHLSWMDKKICEQNEVISFMNSKWISKEEFDKLEIENIHYCVCGERYDFEGWNINEMEHQGNNYHYKSEGNFQIKYCICSKCKKEVIISKNEYGRN